MNERSRQIGFGWRLFQIAALLTAVSWLYSYARYVDPATRLEQAFGAPFGQAWGDVVFVLSPLLSIIAISLAVYPGALRFLTRGSGTATLVARVLLVALPALWIANVVVNTPMADKLFTVPLEPSRNVPIFGGVFLHVVFQHWFQSLAVIVLALFPRRFAPLIDAHGETGLQGLIPRRAQTA